MIIVPKLKKVVILVPRTGSGSLYRAIMCRYPDAMMLYRHMEAGGAPLGYDKWDIVGVVRHPLERLWSLYKYTKLNVKKPTRYKIHPSIMENLKRSVSMSFNDYLMYNTFKYPVPDVCIVSNEPEPFRKTIYHRAENELSQKSYFDTGLRCNNTTLYHYETDLPKLAEDLDILMEHENKTSDVPMPTLSEAAINYAKQTFDWEQTVLGYKV